MDARCLLRTGRWATAAAALLVLGCTSSGDLTTLVDSALNSLSSVLADSSTMSDATSDGTATADASSDTEAGRPHGGPGHLIELLGLSEEQQTQADSMHEQMRADIDALVEPAEQELLEILTDEQETQLDGHYGLLLGLPPHHDGPPGPPPTEEEIAAAESDPNFIPPPHRGGPPPMGGRGGPMGGGHGPGMGPPPGPPPTLDDLAAEFSLTDEQVTQIAAIREALQADIQAVHDASLASFKAILTAEQLVIFEEFEANRPKPPSAGE